MTSPGSSPHSCKSSRSLLDRLIRSEPGASSESTSSASRSSWPRFLLSRSCTASSRSRSSLAITRPSVFWQSEQKNSSKGSPRVSQTAQNLSREIILWLSSQGFFLPPALLAALANRSEASPAKKPIAAPANRAVTISPMITPTIRPIISPSVAPPHNGEPTSLAPFP